MVACKHLSRIRPQSLRSDSILHHHYVLSSEYSDCLATTLSPALASGSDFLYHLLLEDSIHQTQTYTKFTSIRLPENVAIRVRGLLPVNMVYALLHAITTSTSLTHYREHGRLPLSYGLLGIPFSDYLVDTALAAVSETFDQPLLLAKDSTVTLQYRPSKQAVACLNRTQRA
ncbi:unnamed protein product [Somion occarium]|uniref:Uncharacterized protein n=1 Tax=Somion occarium TaxID=3059160 RepID=A0ABP1CZ41_9APHY